MRGLQRVKKLEEKRKVYIQSQIVRYDSKFEDINTIANNTDIFSVYLPVDDKDN